MSHTVYKNYSRTSAVYYTNMFETKIISTNYIEPEINPHAAVRIMNVPPN